MQDADWYTLVEFVYENPSDEQDTLDTEVSDVFSHISPTSQGEYAPTGSSEESYAPTTVHHSFQESSPHSPLVPRPREATADVTASNNNTPPLTLTSVSGSTPRVSVWSPKHTDRAPHERLRDVSTEPPLSRSFSSSIELSQSPDTISGNRHWPPANENEALLLRHFVAKLSLWVNFHTPMIYV